MTSFRDSVDPRAVPPSDIVGGYGDGRWIWSPAWYDGTSNGWDLHPNGRHLVFVVDPAAAGDALDVERGDATPADAPGWVQRWDRTTGWRAAMLYMNRDTWPAVVAALAAAGIDPAGPHVDYLLSTLDGTTTYTVPPGAKPPVAIQARGSALTRGNYDEWVIVDSAWAEGGPMALDPNDPIVQDLQSKVDQLFTGWFTQQNELQQLAAWQATAKAELDQIAAAAAALEADGVPPATLQPVLDSLAKLSAHLGVGTA